MKMKIEPGQVQSDHGYACLTPFDCGHGSVGFWTSLFKQPVYLLREGPRVYLVTFSDQAWADEWLEEHGENYEILWQFEPE